MKKELESLAASVVMACAFGLMAEETAFEGQPIGSIAVTGTGRSTIVAVAFREISGEVRAISVSNVLSTVNLAPGDRAYVCINGKYKSWTLDSRLQWEATDQDISLDRTGGVTSHPGEQADAVRLAFGDGFWLVRTTANGRNLDLPFYLFGAAVTQVTTTAVPGAKSLMGNPRPVATTPRIDNAHRGDAIGLIAGDGRAYLNEYHFNGTSWTHEVAGAGGLPISQETTVTIPAGLGFWYRSTGSEAVRFTWE